MNHLLECMFRNRGYDVQDLRDLLHKRHPLPKDMDTLCARLHAYQRTGKLLVLLTDIDMDGIMSGVIGYAGLSELGFRVALYIPDTSMGYGFSSDTIDDLLTQYPDAAGILTGDVGATAYDGVSHALSLGLDIFVTDHHLCFHPAPASVLVDPQRPDDPDAYGLICGAHVMYLALLTYARMYGTSYQVSQIQRLRVFAGIGTVSDAMPLCYENRQLVADAVTICRLLYADGSREVVSYFDRMSGCDVYRLALWGIYFLCDAFAQAGKLTNSASIHEDFFSYYVAPAFNSIKRMSGDLSQAYLVFFGGEKAAQAAMSYLLDLTQERRELVASSHQKIREADQPWAPYVYLTDAPGGIRGLLAQDILSSTGEPAFVVAREADGSYAGSGRCPSWFPFLDLTAGKSFCRAAGHNSAFGIFLPDDAALDDLVAFLFQEIPQQMSADTETFHPDFVISTLGDGDAGLSIPLFSDFLRELDGWRPFGSGFPPHRFLLRFQPSDGTWIRMGDQKQHLKVRFPGGLELVCFYQGSLFSSDLPVEAQLTDVVEVSGELCYHEYQGERSIQIVGSLFSDCVLAESLVFSRKVG